jgi:light-regulated signal transduction histidine kinase (bacteriophytochrome)
MQQDLSLRSKVDLDAPSLSTVNLSEEQLTSGSRYVTNKFSYLPAGDISPTTSTAGQKIYRCEDEPIHIPGAIQSFGALVAVREEDGAFLVRVISENSGNVIGLEPEALFELRCFTDLLSQADRKEFIIRAHALSATTSRNIPDVFAISLTPSLGAPIPLFCAMHLSTDSNLFICEFESGQLLVNPRQPQDSGPLGSPVQVIGDGTTENKRPFSMKRRSQPLSALEVARSSSRQLTLLDVFQIHQGIENQLATATELSSLFDVIVDLVQDLTGFHRVMVYQFDTDGAGM